MVSAEKLFIAFGWGVASAVAFPMGAAVAFVFPMKKKVNAGLLAFGIGALLFALAYELFIQPLCDGQSKLVLGMIAVGSVIGALVFEFTNWVLDNRGAFLRHFNQRKEYLRSRLKRLLKEEATKGEQYKAHVKSRYRSRRHKSFIGGKPYAASPSIMISQSRASTFKKPPLIASKSAPEVKRRNADITRPLLGDSRDSYLSNGDSNHNSSADAAIAIAQAQAAARAAAIAAEIADPDFSETPPISTSQFNKPKKRVDWKLDNEEQAIEEAQKIVVNGDEEDGDQELQSPEKHENSIQLAKQLGANIEEKYVGLVIWLGLLIDSIPESIVIGLLTIKPEGMSYSFIFGVFLSNFPEALSSSVIMMDEGFSKKAVFGMWIAVMLSTGLGAVIGAASFTENPDEAQNIAANTLKGMAGGAMLVMIARTGLPEAFHQAGNIVGFSTLFGFLAAFICAFTLDDL